MPQLRPAAYSFVAIALIAASASAFAGDADWQKSYPVSAKPSLAFSTGDASTECGRAGNAAPSASASNGMAGTPEYIISEFQTGDHVNFEIKEKVHLHMFVGVHHQPQVMIETPAALDLEGRTTDGSLRVSGLQGGIQLHTSDGSVEVGNVSGALRLTSSDGSIRIHNMTGTLESRSSDGSVQIDGQFTGVFVHTSDGSLDLTLAGPRFPKLATASRVESSDGRVVVHVPRNLATDVPPSPHQRWPHSM